MLCFAQGPRCNLWGRPCCDPGEHCRPKLTILSWILGAHELYSCTSQLEHAGLSPERERERDAGLWLGEAGYPHIVMKHSQLSQPCKVAVKIKFGEGGGQKTKVRNLMPGLCQGVPWSGEGRATFLLKGDSLFSSFLMILPNDKRAFKGMSLHSFMGCSKEMGTQLPPHQKLCSLPHLGQRGELCLSQFPVSLEPLEFCPLPQPQAPKGSVPTLHNSMLLSAAPSHAQIPLG